MTHFPTNTKRYVLLPLISITFSKKLPLKTLETHIMAFKFYGDQEVNNILSWSQQVAMIISLRTHFKNLKESKLLLS